MVPGTGNTKITEANNQSALGTSSSPKQEPSHVL